MGSGGSHCVRAAIERDCRHCVSALRHCERSEAIHFTETSLIVDCHVASLLAMTHLQTMCEALRHCVPPSVITCRPAPFRASPVILCSPATLRARTSHCLSEHFFCIFFTKSLKMNSENGILLSIYIIEDFAHRIAAYNNLSSWIFVGSVRVAARNNSAVSIQKCDFINFCTPKT